MSVRNLKKVSRAPASAVELLAMPEREYMSALQIAFFRNQLLTMRQTLIDNVSETGAHLQQVEVATDPMDRATQEEEQAIELRTRDRERKLMRKIAQVLERIEDGSYGWCEETGEAIGLQRLLARPTATLCLEAQERREKRERVYGH
jgi:DnaK suppressor protein